MKKVWVTGSVIGGVVLMATSAQAGKCKEDAVRVGAACVDKYEASVWETTDPATIKNIQKGRIQAIADLALATQRGVASDDYGAGCPDTAAGCMDFYAVSMPGVTPAAFITWFQAAAACANANKRLATNQEWQIAALGTPDPGTDDDTNDCNVTYDAQEPASTGARSLCVSDRGAFDLVGNLAEWVADWIDQASGCTNWSPAYGGDYSCVGNGSANFPGALIRGGYSGDFANAGAYFVYAGFDPSASAFQVGFRCAREP